MAESALVDRQVEAGREFLAKYRLHFPIDFAFWLYSEDRPEGQLFVVSDESRGGNIREAYSAVIKLLPWLDSVLDVERVQLIPSRHPLAQQIAQARVLTGGKKPLDYTRMFYGYAPSARAYLYEDPDGAPGSAIPQPVTAGA